MRIEITKGRWWYEDMVGEVLEVKRFVPEYNDDAVGWETSAYEVVNGDLVGYYVLAEDCRRLDEPVSAESTDAVNHPSHYTTGKFEVIDIIEQVTSGYDDPFVGYNVGNVQKYIARAPHKGKLVEDLRKAAKYLEFAIEYLEREE